MLTSKISCLLVASLAFLLGALLVVPIQGQTWAAFHNKHIESHNQYPLHGLNSYCRNQMRYRGMTNPLCKPLNTFIFENAIVIQRLCQRDWQQNTVTSGAYFDMIDCKNTGGFPPNNCNYQGRKVNQRIVITCEKHYPIHYNYSIY